MGWCAAVVWVCWELRGHGMEWHLVRKLRLLRLKGGFLGSLLSLMWLWGGLRLFRVDFSL